MCLKSIVVVEIKLMFYVSCVVSQYWFTLDFLEELLPTFTSPVHFFLLSFFFNSTTSGLNVLQFQQQINLKRMLVSACNVK